MRNSTFINTSLSYRVLKYDFSNSSKILIISKNSNILWYFSNSDNTNNFKKLWCLAIFAVVNELLTFFFFEKWVINLMRMLSCPFYRTFLMRCSRLSLFHQGPRLDGDWPRVMWNNWRDCVSVCTWKVLYLPSGHI